MELRSGKMIAKKCREESPRSESNESEVRVHSRHSFDRFGDDLCQYLLSYMTFEDRFRCECVAKQWQRLIFTTQTDLISLNAKYELNVDSFECILKKCPNITSIDCYQPEDLSFESMLDLVIKHCNGLHTFRIHIMKQSFHFTVHHIMGQFFTKFAKQLKTIHLTNCSHIEDSINTNIQLCNNITQFDFISHARDDWICDLLSKPKLILFPKLSKVSIILYPNVSHVFEGFVNNYKNQLKSLKLEICYVNNDGIIDGTIGPLVMNSLSKMHKLIDLHFINNYNIDFKQFSQQLRQLKRLSLDFPYSQTPDWTQVMQTIVSDFKRLKRVSLKSRAKIDVLLPTRLTHLTLYTEVNDKFWSTIHTNLPNLHYIDIRMKHITDSVLNGLSLVPKLRYTKLEGQLKSTRHWYSRN